MSTYAKIWTDIFNDDWFLGLSACQRSIWLQLIITAKMHGDSGVVSGRSRAAIGSAWGCDGSTSGKILGKFRDDNKINLTYNDNGTIVIEILNYEYWQRVRNVKDKTKKRGQAKGKQTKNPPIIREDKIREDKIREPQLKILNGYDLVKIKISQADYEVFKKDYPRLYVDKHIKDADIWAKNAGAQGNKSNWKKFMNNWLSRENKNPQTPKRPKTAEEMYVQPPTK